jgi:hypothetical protein
MAFKGTLREFRVPDILQMLSLQKKTGILTFNSSDGFISIIFEDGHIVGVDAFPKKLEMRMGNVLVKQEIISEEMLHRALTIQKRTGQKVGEILTGMGLLNQETTLEALKTQASQIVLSLFNWKKGEYNFKVMDFVGDELRTFPPMSTDNLIMEGVQMLDEWPHIKAQIPSADLIFEPTPQTHKKIEIRSEYEDEVHPSDPDHLILSETEFNLLKLINGKNRVSDLVEMGLFTEYKIYKNVYNLINKSLIRVVKQKIEENDTASPIMALSRQRTHATINQLYVIILLIIILSIVLTFFKPFKPFLNDNIIQRHDVYNNLFDTTAPDS